VVVVMGGGENDTAPNARCGLAGADTVLPSGSTAKPVKTGTAVLTSGFGMRWGQMHRGVDLAGPVGTAIYAFADGVVAQAGPASGFGQWIVLDHNLDGRRFSTVYGHMFPVGVLARGGDLVRAGQQIARIGNDGDTTGPHLHFEVWEGTRLAGGTAVDPQPFYDAAADPGSAPAQPPAPAPDAAALSGDTGPPDPGPAAGARLAPLPAAKGSEANMTVNGVRVQRTIAARFPAVAAIGGWRPADPYPDHPSGRAVDAMIPHHPTAEGIALGDQVAGYFVTNADAFEVDYILWRGRMWRNGAWAGAGDNGSDTANHMDHVHITTRDSPKATGGETFGAPPEGGAAADTCAGLGGALNAASVPSEFAPWLHKAGALCPQVPASLLAAQLDAESGFSTTAVSYAGAQGPAQFMPGTWPGYGRDDDGNGQVSPFDIGDAVMAQGRFMCEIAATIDAAVADGRVTAPNGPTELYLAGYNAGPGAVLRSGGFPTGHSDYLTQTKPYADKIIAAEATYRAGANQ
jgi:hypothetical protein